MLREVGVLAQSRKGGGDTTNQLVRLLAGIESAKLVLYLVRSELMRIFIDREEIGVRFSDGIC